MDQKEYEAILKDAEGRIRRLRHLYDMWFQGLERREPSERRREVELLLTTLRREHQRNTALRFRFDQVCQRYQTYTTYWQRVARQIEEGTYKRDVIRAQRLREQAAEQTENKTGGRQALELEPDMDVDAALADAKRHADKPITPFARPAPGAGSGNGISDQQIQQLYDRYVAARARNSERVDNVRVEAIAKSIRTMMPKLAEKHAGKKIEFKVVVKNGRVALKPVAK